MISILNNRWKECGRCVSVGAPLAATVMIGGLLESLLMSKIEQEKDKSKIFSAKAIPVDKNGKKRDQADWTLRVYLEVAHDLGWVTQTARKMLGVLGEYRNFIHPYKEFTQKVKITPDDAYLFWKILIEISRQLTSETSPR